MKSQTVFLTALFCLEALSSQAPPATRRVVINSYNTLPRSFFAPYLGSQTLPAPQYAIQPTQASINMQEEQWRQKMEFLSEVDSPWRVIAGKTNLVIGEGWQKFWGRVTQVLPDGILVDGGYSDHQYDTTIFYVAGFPYSVADGDTLSSQQHWAAKLAGTFTYTSVLGASTTVHQLLYGKPCSPPPLPQPTAEQISDRQTALSLKSAQSADRVLKYHQELADKGDAYGEYQMGLRYLKGDGVEKDPQKARLMFIKAAAQGKEEASSELEKLSNKSP